MFSNSNQVKVIGTLSVKKIDSLLLAFKQNLLKCQRLHRYLCFKADMTEIFRINLEVNRKTSTFRLRQIKFVKIGHLRNFRKLKKL
jgi:hypothetical protein